MGHGVQPLGRLLDFSWGLRIINRAFLGAYLGETIAGVIPKKHSEPL
jgi:hypothetical protein